MWKKFSMFKRSRTSGACEIFNGVNCGVQLLFCEDMKSVLLKVNSSMFDFQDLTKFKCSKMYQRRAAPNERNSLARSSSNIFLHAIFYAICYHL